MSPGLLALLACALALSLKPTHQLKVKTKYGVVSSTADVAGIHALRVFKNVPYAKQPIGDLRFELPQTLEETTDEVNLSHDDVYCPQIVQNEEDGDRRIIGQEDCLMLDIYVRKEHNSSAVSLPVLVYFHPGTFRYGSKEDHGADYLLRYNDIVLVVPNYRLGILGFLSLPNNPQTGNLGLWDQRAALLWVQENIKAFGGDPKKVTIGGHEAGGSSVGFHVLSPLSHAYFRSAISSSGTALDPWTIDAYASVETGIRTVSSLDCSLGAFATEVSCMRNLSFEDILKEQSNHDKLSFLPTIDGMSRNSFIPYHPRVLYERGYQSNVPYLLGYKEHESKKDVSESFLEAIRLQNLDKIVQYFLRPYFRNVSNFAIVATAVKYHYLRGMPIPSFDSLEPQITNMMNDFLHRSPLEQVLEFQSRASRNTFLYELKYQVKNLPFINSGERKLFGDEVFIFNKNADDREIPTSSEDERASRIIAESWGNFILFQHPDETGSWRQYGENNQMNYVEISTHLHPKSHFRNDETEFWNAIVQELVHATNGSRQVLEEHSMYHNMGTWGAAGLSILCCVLVIALVGLVVITKRRNMMMSILPASSTKEEVGLIRR